VNNLLRTKLFKLDIGPVTFSPGILPTIATLFFIYLMVTLGQWQAEKARFKVDLEDKVMQRKDLPVVTLDELPQSIDEKIYLPVTAFGRYEAARHFLLDNRILNGKVGYDVYTPLILSDETVILVNRGFIEQGKTREDLPEVITPVQKVSIKGLIDKPPSKTVVLADNVNNSDTWPIVLQYLDIEEIKVTLGIPVYDMIIRLDENEEHGFVREIPALNLRSDKNAGYAFQWYTLTLTLVIIYFVVNTKKRDDS